MDDDQKRSFFALAIRMILTDGEIKPEEISYLNLLIAESGIPGEVSLSQSVEMPDMAIYDSRASRLAVSIELMTIATIDSRLHDLESAMFKLIISKFHLRATDLGDIRSLAADCADLFRDGCRIAEI